MSLSIRRKPYVIPEYSLTGDLLAYLSCGLQYRYHSKGSLPPSTPVQLWFGEFIHGVMEEAYLRWRERKDHQQFPWNWAPEIREVELEIDRRLRAKGLYPTPRVFCPYDSSTTTQGLCPDAAHPHKLIASSRAEASINTWGPHLFPLIDESEVILKGIRGMPNYQPGISRSNYYGVTGVIDVISSVRLRSCSPGNLILHYMHQNPCVQKILADLAVSEYEVIIDYKGMRRPSTNSDRWDHHKWQILTYAWLRSQVPGAKRIVAGILFYLNELVLSGEDTAMLKDDVVNSSTDIMPRGQDESSIRRWKPRSPTPNISGPFREERSIRIVPCTPDPVGNALQQFDGVVDRIENCVLSETRGRSIVSSWQPNPDERNCTACDFKTFCPNPKPGRYVPAVP